MVPLHRGCFPTGGWWYNTPQWWWSSCRNQRGLCQSREPRELSVAQLPWGWLVAVSVLLKNRFFRFIWDAWTGVPRNPSLILHCTQINPSVHACCHWGVSNLLLACFKIDFYLLENLKAPTGQNLWHICIAKLPTMHHTIWAHSSSESALLLPPMDAAGLVWWCFYISSWISSMCSLAKGRSAITGDWTQQVECRQVFFFTGKKKKIIFKPRKAVLGFQVFSSEFNTTPTPLVWTNTIQEREPWWRKKQSKVF